MRIKDLIFILVFLAIVGLLGWASTHECSYIDTGTGNYKSERVFFRIKIYENITGSIFSKYLKNTNLNTTTNWHCYFRQGSIWESFENTGRYTGKQNDYFLFKWAEKMSLWLMTYGDDISNPKDIDYQLVHDKVVEFLVIFRAGDKVRLEKFMETLK